MAVTRSPEPLEVGEVALAQGDWQAMEDRLARGLALEREHGRGNEPARIAVEVTRFRYAYRLIAAKELLDWLAERALELADLQRHCLRRLLVDEHGAAGARVAAPELNARDVHAELVCSRTLAAALKRMGDLAAMAATCRDVRHPPDEALEALIAQACAHPRSGLGALTEDDLERRAARVLSLLQAETEFVAMTATPDSVGRWLSQHRVDWLRVECSELVLAGEGAAREALLCMRIDGMSLTQVAEQLASPVQSRAYYVGELDDRSGPLLASAAIGAPVGPLQADDGWRVVVVDARVPPSSDDRELVGRATAALVHTARERVRAGRVRELASL